MNEWGGRVFETPETWREQFLRRISRLNAFTAHREAERASEDIFVLTYIINKSNPPSPSPCPTAVSLLGLGTGVGRVGCRSRHGGWPAGVVWLPCVRGMEGEAEECLDSVQMVYKQCEPQLRHTTRKQGRPHRPTAPTPHEPPPSQSGQRQETSGERIRVRRQKGKLMSAPFKLMLPPIRAGLCILSNR